MKFLLVGQMFTQGAPAVIAKGLGQATKVELRAEPDNPYDANAVRVLVGRSAVIETPALLEALLGFGMTLDSIAWPMPLGHLGAKAETKAARAARQGGHQFALCAEWHALSEAERASGSLLQYPDGVFLIDVPLASGATK